MTEEGPNTAAQSDATVSNINRPWLIRIVIISACLLGYAAWSLYDAYVAYPARGEAYASYAEWQYLGTAIEADRTESPGILRREGAVADPVGELARLKSESVRSRNEEDLGSGGPRAKRAEMEIARQSWLSALSIIGRLKPAYTNFYANPDEAAAEQLAETELSAGNAETASGLRSTLQPMSPRDRFAELSARWSSETQPSTLRSYDIPVNQLQAAICLAFLIYLVTLMFRVATRKYRWDPATKALTLPGGATITPADLDDVDKRKWDKFIVFLKIKDSHEKLAGEEIRFDTYRNGRIENWILEMEKAAFPDRVAEAAASKKAESESADGDAADRAPEGGDSGDQAKAG